MKKLLLLILPLGLLIGCSQGKQEIVDKCLLQANQKFPTDMTQNSQLFQSCMVKYKYAFNAHNCDQNNQEHIFSEICYVKY